MPFPSIVARFPWVAIFVVVRCLCFLGLVTLVSTIALCHCVVVCVGSRSSPLQVFDFTCKDRIKAFVAMFALVVGSRMFLDLHLLNTSAGMLVCCIGVILVGNRTNLAMAFVTTDLVFTLAFAIRVLIAARHLHRITTSADT